MFKDLDEHVVDKIVLIDKDTLEIKNLPYLNIVSKKSSYINKPKVFALHNFINQFNKNILVETHVCNYGDFKNGYANIIRDYLLIDCRDTNEVLKNTYLKVNLDGPFGMARYNPKEKISDKISRYSYGNSKFNASLFTSLVVQQFFSRTFGEEKNYAFNLESFGGIITCL